MSDTLRARTAAILTLGCKLNIADSEVMARRLRDAGWDVVDRAIDADAVIVNTCSVTHVADHKSRHLVRLARRVAPDATVALTGCLLETAPWEKVEALGADVVYRQPQQLALAEKLIELRGPAVEDGALPLPQPSPWRAGVPGPTVRGRLYPRRRAATMCAHSASSRRHVVASARSG